MKTERVERKKTYNQMLNGSKNVIADELMFNLLGYIKTILRVVKEFFRDIMLFVGNEKAKERATSEIITFFDNKDLNKSDVFDIAVDTDKEKELFEYANISKRQEKR